MLVYGTCNPEGYGDSSYEGLYLTDADICEITPAMSGVPVKIEHRGVDVGKVVTAWMHEGRMDVLMELDGRHIEAELGKVCKCCLPSMHNSHPLIHTHPHLTGIRGARHLPRSLTGVQRHHEQESCWLPEGNQQEGGGAEHRSSGGKVSLRCCKCDPVAQQQPLSILLNMFI